MLKTQKPLPIGISDFKKVIDGGYAYVDKTLFIEELIEKGAHASLMPRMRRFGKTLNLSMLRYFFEKGKTDVSYLFKDLAIWKNEKCRALQGKFPVIFLSLKDVKHSSWQETYTSLQRLVASEFGCHSYLLEENTLSDEEKKDFLSILRKEAAQPLLEQSLRILSQWLYRYNGKRVILLIDEYDTPAHAAYLGNYYDTFISFLRNWLSGGLKDNSSLEWGVLTGILRVAKESIFSGLNNINTFTILSEDFQNHFGLLESEVRQLLADYHLLHCLEDFRSWYNGYRVGSCLDIYNPWSVLNCIAKKGALAPYWVNTSDNALVKRLIAQGSDDLKVDIEEFLQGGIVEKTIEEGILFSDLEKNQDLVWSLLLFSGYLTFANSPSYGTPCQLRIPNTEVGELYRTMVLEWFKTTIRESQYRLLLQSLTTGDIDTFSKIFQKFLLSSVSVFDVTHDETEKVYHAFVLGMLVGLKDTYEIKSNRESGYGRYDVMLIPKNPNDLAVIMEFKKIDSGDETDLDSGAESALKQIEEKKYSQELLTRGINRMIFLGLAFKGKLVLIRSQSITEKN